jgi:CBS domain-containing protein
MRRLVERQVDAGPVVDADGSVVGLLSTGDIIVQESELHGPTVLSILGASITLPESAHRFEEDLRRMLSLSVRDAMTVDPVTCTPDDSLEHAATLMHDRDVSRLPVVDGGKLVGIVARGDIVRAIVEAGR